MTRILWVDDGEESIRNTVEIITSKFSATDFEIVASKDEAEELLSLTEARQTYDAAIFDLMLGDAKTTTTDGSELVAKYSRRAPTHPCFVYSAYLPDEDYRRNLDDAFVVAAAEKNERMSHLVADGNFFDTICRIASEYSEVKRYHPEGIEFADYMRRPDSFAEEVGSHWKRNKHWLRIEFERSASAWLVVCGSTIVASDENPRTFPDDEEIIALGEKHSLIPFSYSVPHVPEMIDPNQSTSSSDKFAWSGPLKWADFYPTIKLDVSGEFIADFDTGAFRTHLPESRWKSSFPLRPIQTLGENDVHLGRKYRKFTKTVEVELVLSNGNRLSKKIPVDFVVDWDKSPFVEVNTKRLGLAGRDLLDAFPIEVRLNGCRKQTSVIDCRRSDDDD